LRLVDLTRAAGLPGDAAGLAAAEVDAITADSREVAPGALFAALPGTRADGATYIAQAVSRGAVAVLAAAGTPWPDGIAPVPLLRADDPRQALALMAAAFYAAQPATLVVITGTNGKTSTAEFLRQLWTLDGQRAASIGTLGIVAEGFPPGPTLTTPDPVTLHERLAALATAGFARAAIEASSHGLEQRRLDGVRLTAAGFSNLTRDHLDFHGGVDAYRTAKLRLFDTLLPTGAPAVFNADMDGMTLECLRAIAARRGLRRIEVGEAGREIRLLAVHPQTAGQVLEIEAGGVRQTLDLALPGRFQAENVLMAAALAIATGLPNALALAPKLVGVRGRMEFCARLPNGAAIYVDYAHTPDALERLLMALRPHVTGQLHVVFGAGGDRDPGKRPLMGQACARLADRCWITDDNPRGEDPALIRAAIRAACPDAVEIGDRADAIAAAMAALRPGDVLAVAGKGHESGQTIAGVTLPFDDAAVVKRLAGVAP
jgi:UDP-N-acetylmuramoyl-L-alanyl-D-glutamate--2,6-diaminopimelate ligase